MLKLFASVILFCWANNAYTQEQANKFLSEESIKIINSLPSVDKASGCLMRKIPSWHLSLLKTHFAKDSILRKASGGKKPSSDIIVLTQTEKQKIDSTLLDFEKFEWTDASANGLKFYLEPTAYDIINNGKTLTLPICRITPPLFLRNETLCLVYYSYECGGLCGRGSLIIYQKDKDGWKIWSEIDLWTS